MRLQYLGTAAAEGWPAIFCNCKMCEEARRLGGKNIRTRQQAILNGDLLFDICPDTYMHALQNNLDLSGVHTLLMTHSHSDHHNPYQLGMRADGFAHAPTEDILYVFGNECVISDIRNKLTYHYGDSIKKRVEYSYVPLFVSFSSGGYTITPLLADHMPNCPEEHCYLYIVEREGKRMLYGNDTGLFPTETMNYIKGIPFDLVSLDCTLGTQDYERNHMGINATLKQIELMKKYGCTKADTIYVLTHFSHNSGLLHEQLVERLSPHGVQIAYDGMVIDF